MSLRGEGRFSGEENILSLKINVVAPLGEKMDVYASTENHPLIVARVDAEGGLEPSQNVDMQLDMRKIHIFESGEAELNLSLT